MADVNYHLGFWILLVLLLLLFLLLIASMLYTYLAPVRTREALYRVTDVPLVHEGGTSFLGYNTATVLAVLRLQDSAPSATRVREAIVGVLGGTDLTGRDPTYVAELVLKELDVVATSAATAVELFLQGADDNMCAAVVSRGVVNRPLRWDPKEAPAAG